MASRYATESDWDADLFVIACLSLFYLGQFEDAYRFLRLAGEREERLLEGPDFGLVAAMIAQAANYPDEMKRYIDAAWLRFPENPDVARHAYAMNFELGDLETFRRVQADVAQRGFAPAQMGLAPAIVTLAEGNYQEGFRLLEGRYQLRDAQRYLNPALFTRPRWTGGALMGQRLLVSAEQGLGDTIQMARYFPDLEVRADRQLIVEVQTEAILLLQHTFPGLTFVAGQRGQLADPQFDLWTGLMSLPHLLGTTSQNVPRRSGYLKVPVEHMEYWRKRVAELSGGTRLPRIGLAWSGNPAHRADRRRSIPVDKMMSFVRGWPARFFALQTQVPAAVPENLTCVSDELITLADTAALISHMDLVISVDTSVVHLAGALGKETWLLLPRRYEWRWGLEGEWNPWYDSVRVLRQSQAGDWGALLDEVFQRQLPNRLSVGGV